MYENTMVRLPITSGQLVPDTARKTISKVKQQTTNGVASTF